MLLEASTLLNSTSYSYLIVNTNYVFVKLAFNQLNLLSDSSIIDMGYWRQGAYERHGKPPQVTRSY